MTLDSPQKPNQKGLSKKKKMEQILQPTCESDLSFFRSRHLAHFHFGTTGSGRLRTQSHTSWFNKARRIFVAMADFEPNIESQKRLGSNEMIADGQAMGHGNSSMTNFDFNLPKSETVNFHSKIEPTASRPGWP